MKNLFIYRPMNLTDVVLAHIFWSRKICTRIGHTECLGFYPLKLKQLVTQLNTFKLSIYLKINIY